MSTIKAALERARSAAQDVREQIEAYTAKHHAALQTDVQGIAVRAKQLASSRGERP